MSHTTRSQTIYAYILRCHEDNELVPTMREIAEACHLPLSTVFRHLDWLETRGYVSRGNTTRSIRLLRPLLTDEEQVYACLVHALQVNDVAPSPSALREACQLPVLRVKAALQKLEQEGRVQCDPEDPRLFYPLEVEQIS